MKKAIAIFLLTLLVLNVASQVNRYGNPLMKSYSTQQINGSDYTHSIIKDHSGNIYLANEDKGIIRYDGNTWRAIPVRNNAIIRTMGIDRNGIIYAGGKFEFGYVEPDLYGRMTYISLSQRIDSLNNRLLKDTLKVEKDSLTKQIIKIGEIMSLVVKDSSVYFIGKDGLFDYNITSDSLSFYSLRKYGLLNIFRTFQVNSRIMIGDNVIGLSEFANNEIIKLPGGDFFGYMRCMAVLPYDSVTAVVATFQNGIFLYNYKTGELKKDFISHELGKRLIESRIYTGYKLPSGQYAIGTIGGGVFIINRDGNLLQQWNKDNSNLQDNGILAFYCDNNYDSELWVSTVRFITKVYQNLPFTEFSVKAGLEGGVNCIDKFNSEIYISTDNGVYKSTTLKDGLRTFERVPGIFDVVFPLYHAIVGSNDFMLAGSINGIFQIRKDGRVVKVELKNEKGRIESKLDIDARIITQSKIKPERFYIGSGNEGITILDFKAGMWSLVKKISKIQGSITGITEITDGSLLVSTDFSNSLFRVSGDYTTPVPYGPEKGAPYASIISMTEIGKDIILCTSKGIYKYVENGDNWISCDEIAENLSVDKECYGILKDDEGNMWLGINEKGKNHEMMIADANGEKLVYSGPLALLPNVKMMDLKLIEGKIFEAKSNSVYVIEKEKLMRKPEALTPFITKIVAGRDSVLMQETFFRTGMNGRRMPLTLQSTLKIPELKYKLNSVSLFWSTPYYINEEETAYSYKLEGFDKVWSVWGKVNYKDYTNLPFGKYSFRIKARTATETETQEAVYEFIILKPWYLTAGMVILYGLLIVLIIFLIIKMYTKKLKNENIRLEGIVAERTAVVVKQKEELESSIHYASRIQMALLPSESILAENLKNYFILFKPRDIVSGDFYWMTKKNERLYIVAADCTGHGVPGAFMSLLGMSFLDEIIDKEEAPRANHILSQMRLHVTESLKQIGTDDEAKDGMDMALLVVDFNTSRIEFSGAYNPCFRVRRMTMEEIRNFRDENLEMPDGSMSNGKHILETIYASKMPIGISSRMKEEFSIYECELESGVSYYMFSDGYIDQFGGPNGRKFMKKNFKRLILEIQDQNMNKQKEMLDQNLKSWMGQTPQIDDILVLGIKTG
jgi:serine phosphatase RsbU (regulator of sigma subunit)